MRNPWKDIAPYTREDASNFKGRNDDIVKFSKIIERSRYSVIYAESGIGKTSFLNAGIYPTLETKNYHFINIEFPTHILTSDADDLEVWLCNKITNEEQLILEVIDAVGEVPLEFEEKFNSNLWWKLHGYRYKKNIEGNTIEVIPVIVFDQFEEVFQKSSNDRLKQLFGIIDTVSSNIPPLDIINELDNLNNNFLRLKSSSSFKVIFSLRKEYLAEFDYWTNEFASIPELLQNRMILLPFTKEQAEEVIMLQRVDGVVVDTLHRVKEDILKLFEKKDSKQSFIRKDLGYEAFLLSVICSKLFEISCRMGKEMLSKEDLVAIELNSIVYSYYLQSITSAGIKDSHLRIIEDVLVNEDGERNRMPLSTPKLKAIGFGKKYKDKLVNKHIVKYTPDGYDNNDSGYVELIHDRVAKTIALRRKNNKKNRRNKVQRILLLLFIFITTLAALQLGLRTKSFTAYDTREMLDESFVYPDDFHTDKYEDKQLPNHIRSLCLTLDKIKMSAPTISDLASLEEVIVKNRNFSNDVTLSILRCDRLSSVIFPEDTKNLSFTVDSCNNLRYIKLPDSLSTLSLSLYATNDIYIDVPASLQDRFLFEKGVLWDLVNKSILYVSSKKDTVKVSYPEQFEVCDSIIEYTRWRPYAKVKVVNCKGKAPFIDIKENRITAIECYDIDTLDLSIPEYDHINIIAKEALANCKSLKYIVLPRNLKSIEAGAFSGCTKLEQVVFPESLKTIEEGAFKGCVSLKNIDMSLTKKALSIGVRAFEGCNSLATAKFPNEVEFKKSVIRNLEYYDQFFGCNDLRAISIGGSLLSSEKGIFFYDAILLHAMPGFSYNDNKYITKEGVLYSKEYYDGKKFLQPVLSHNEISQDIPFYNAGIILNGGKVTYLPIRKWIYCYNSGNIEELHIATIYPGQLDGLTDYEKKNIILYVPYGCKKYYIFDNDYKAFKDIREDPLFLRIKNLVCECVKITNVILSFHNLKVGLALILLLMFCFIFRFVYKDESKRADGDCCISKYIKSILFIKSLLVFVLFLVIWTSVYWLLFWVLENIFDSIVSSIISHLLAICIAVLFAWTILDQRSVNILKEKFSSAWLVYSNASAKELGTYIYNGIKAFTRGSYYMLIVLCCIITFITIQFVIGYVDKRSHINHDLVKYIYKNDGLSYDEVRRSENIYKADDILAVHANEGLVAYKKSNELLISNIFTGDVYKSYQVSNRINAASFDNNAGKMLVVTSDSLYCINLYTDQMISLDESLGYYSREYKFSMDGNYIIGYYNRSLKAYKVKNIFSKRNKATSLQNLILTYESPESWIEDADISSNGADVVILKSNYVIETISISPDGSYRINELKNIHYEIHKSVRYCKDANLFITNTRVYNNNGVGVAKFYSSHYLGCDNVQFTNDGREIIFFYRSYSGTTIFLLDAESYLWKMTIKVDKPELYLKNTNYYNGKNMIVYKDGYFIEIAPKSYDKMQEEYNRLKKMNVE